MLRPHAHDIAAALPSIEAQIESEPLRCPYRPASFKVPYVGLLPRSEALRGCPYIPHANSRVFVSETYIDRMAKQDAQYHKQIIGCRWRLGLLLNQSPDMLGAKARHRLIAMLLPEALNDASIGFPRLVSEALKGR
jgi:hypothetical protein